MSLLDTTMTEQVRVLVVDDDAHTRNLLRRLLERENYTVAEAVDGASAISAVIENPPHAIILDSLMPGLDGLECTRRLKQDPQTRGIPVIMVSADAGSNAVLTALQAGADEYLTKSTPASELVLRVRSMVRLRLSQIETSRSNELRGEQARMLTTLLDLSRTLVATDDLPGVLRLTAHAASELTCCRRVSIMLPDQDKRFLTVAYANGLDEDIISNIRVPIGAAISGHVFATGAVISSDSLTSITRQRFGYDVALFTHEPMISVPMCTSEHVLGVLNLAERHVNDPFSAHELEFIDLICNIAATAIHSVQIRLSRDEARDSIMLAMATLAEQRDNDTGRHVVRVTRFCVLLGEHLQRTGHYCDEIDDDFLADLRRAAPLHDIGKVAIPDAILLKPDNLTDEEMKTMHQHTRIGWETIRSIITHLPDVRFLQLAAEITHSHHERYDGQGYPRRLQGQDIPLSARILTLVDVYDAITSQRVYKASVPHEEALAIIRKGNGTLFDPVIVQAFLACEQEIARLAAELADDDSNMNHTQTHTTTSNLLRYVAAAPP
ncbi:MAG: HD domain-containing phosphohydrolase [Planctomycetota bacterium]